MFLEQRFKQLCFLSRLSRLALFQYLLVPKPISASFCLRGCRQPEINGRVAGNLITRHYEAVMLLWLLCNVTFAGTWNDGGAEGHHIRSFSAQCYQSHTSSWYKNKQLDFQSIMWDCYFLFVLESVRNEGQGCKVWDFWTVLVSSLWPCFVCFSLLTTNCVFYIKSINCLVK